MSYTIPKPLDLGPAHTGKTVYAQLKNESWTNVGDAITTGISEIGSSGMFTALLTVPDDHSGYASFYFSTDDANTPCCPPLGISPEDKEMVTAIYAEQAKDSTVAKITATTAILNNIGGLPTTAEMGDLLDALNDISAADVTAAMTSAGLIKIAKVFTNKTKLDMTATPPTLTVYDDDNTTPLYTMEVSRVGEGNTLIEIKNAMVAA